MSRVLPAVARASMATCAAAAARDTITGREFFPDLISGPFHNGLVVVFALATVLTVLAALASALRGTRHRAEVRTRSVPMAAEAG